MNNEMSNIDDEVPAYDAPKFQVLDLSDTIGQEMGSGMYYDGKT